jgi:hypothetical protein
VLHAPYHTENTGKTNRRDTEPEEEFYGRWFAEIFLYLYRMMAPVRPWRAVVIHPRQPLERLDERRYGSVVKLPEVRRVYLEDWADIPANTVGLRLVQLLVSAASEAPAKARQLLRAPAADEPVVPAPVLLDLVETILSWQKAKPDPDYFQQPLPGRAFEIGDDAAVVDQGFKPAGRVAIARDLDAFESFLRRRAPRMRAQDANFKLGRESFGQFVHETRFRVAQPAWISR